MNALKLSSVRIKQFALIATLGLLGLSGCTTKVVIDAVEPAEITRAAELKHLAVLEFTGDKVGLKDSLEAKLIDHKFNNEQYFVIVSRDALDDVMKEQRFQHSGLTDDSKKAAEVGKLLGAQGLITGGVSRVFFEDTEFTRPGSVCVDLQCTRTAMGDIPCTKRTTSMAAQIRIVDVSVGDVIVAKKYFEQENSQQCQEDTRAQLAEAKAAMDGDKVAMVKTAFSVFKRVKDHSESGNKLKEATISLDEMVENISQKFVYTIAPHNTTMTVELIGSLDVKLEKEDETKFKAAITHIKNKRLDKATELLHELMDLTQGESYAVAYNLGVMKEAESDYMGAKDLYTRADKLTEINPVKVISNAVLRIDEQIQKQALANKQAENQK